MTKLFRLFFFVPLVISVSVATTWAQSRSNPALDQMIEALGGAAFLEVKDIHTTGRFFSFSKGDLSGSDLYSDYIKFPDMERTEFGREKNKSVTINKGPQGWKIEPKNDAEPQPAVQAEEFLTNFKTSFDYVLRFVIKQPQTTIQTLAGEIIDFKRTDVVELRDPSKNRIRFYVDRQTRLPVKMQVRRADRSSIQEELYGNWHKFQGVTTPLFISRSTDGVKTMEIRAETATYNSGFSDSLFEAPPTK
jgi:outer membrane lipoprotein-sorting protein